MLTSVALLATLLAPPPLSKVVAHMKEGVNITRMFCYQSAYTKEGCASYLNKQDFANFENLKVDYVRLCVSPEFIYDKGKPNAEHLPWLDAGIKNLLAAHLVVLLDLHDNGQMGLDKEGADNSGLVSFWQKMAKHYKSKNESSLVFELVNEPQFLKNESVWWNLQAKAVAAIRSVDKERVIVATGTGWGGIDGLVKHAPLADKGVIYSVHSYDPFMFTHQGATWAGEDPKHWKNMPFPSSPEAVAGMVDTLEESYKGPAKWYGEQRFGQGYLDERVKLATDWGHKHKVPVFLGEFGAYPLVSPPESRARWFTMMRNSLEKYKLSRCLWGYDDGFGLGRSLNEGKVTLDPLTLKTFYGVK